MQAEAKNAVLDVGPFLIVADKSYTADGLPTHNTSLEGSAAKPAVVAALERAPGDQERIEEPIDFVSSAGFFIFGRDCSRVVRA